MKYPDLSALFSRQSWALRGGALGLAGLLWLFVKSENNYRMVMDMPIEVRDLSARKALKEDVHEVAQVRFLSPGRVNLQAQLLKEEVPLTAKVRFIGSGRALFLARLLKNFYDDGYKLVLDLERISEEYEFPLNKYFEENPHKVRIPPSFEIEYEEVVDPTEIIINMEEYLVKTVPVIPNVNIQPVAGYVLVGDIIPTPAEVEIAGPKDLVQAITSIETVQDSLLMVEFPVTRVVAIQSPIKSIEYFYNDDPITEIKYFVDIQAKSSRIISEVLVEVTNTLPGLRVFVNPHTVSLTIVGGVNRIAEVQPEDIQILIDFKTQWNTKQQFYEPRVVIPDGILEWRDLSPRNVELVVTKEAG